MNRDLDYVLNYMVKYTQDRYMQDSEPMLNHRDIELVLKHIWELEDKINKAIEYIKKVFPTDFCEMEYESAIKLLEILGDKEQEEYILTKDENGTTQINGEWYRVEKK